MSIKIYTHNFYSPLTFFNKNYLNVNRRSVSFISNPQVNSFVTKGIFYKGNVFFLKNIMFKKDIITYNLLPNRITDF